MEFKPRVLPLNFTDFVISLSVGLVLTLILVILPALAVGFITNSMVGFVFSINILSLVFFFFSVKKVTMSKAGIRFHRLLGGPKFLNWEQVGEILVVNRKELIVQGWLWPLFPAREMSPSFSSLNHVKIKYDDKFVYFPPVSHEDFIARAKELKDRRANS